MTSFCDFCNVYRRFDPRLAKNAASLDKKLKNETPSQFGLDNQEQGAVTELKYCLVSPQVLSLQRTKGQYTGETDALDTQNGCALLKEQEEKVLKPVG